MKRLGLLFLFLAGILCLVGCTGGKEQEKVYQIGIAQFAEHGSLDNCREGFLAGLKEAGIVEGKNLKVNYQNAQADMGIANQIAQAMSSDKVDLICAIATPMAQAAYNAAQPVNIPVIFTAVTDPVAAALAKEDKTPVGSITGTSDKLPIEAQLKMIRELMPQAKKIGILYSTSEVNSETCVAEYKELAGKYGFEIVASGINTSADIPLAADSLVSRVDCLTNLTDNTVVSSLAIVLDKANAKKIPVFGSEIEQVKLGCAAAEGLEYFELGKQTGKMAAQVLKGEKKIEEMNFAVIEKSSLFINSDVLQKLGIAVPDSLQKRAADVVKGA